MGATGFAPQREAVQSSHHLTLAEIDLRAAQAAYDKVAGRDNAGATKDATELWQATTHYEQAQADCQEAREGATADEVSAACSRVALAEAQVDTLLARAEPESVAPAGR